MEFGRKHYDNVAYFNFETNPRLNQTFEENISPDYLIPILSHIAGQTIVREKTLIVFDEVQLCERALTSLKYFCEDAPDYHIIVAGGSCQQSRILIPGWKGRHEDDVSDGRRRVYACFGRRNVGCTDSEKL